MIDAYTETWREVTAEANKLINASRDRLEANDQHYGESQFLRGKIAALREILSMAKPVVVSNVSQPEKLRPLDRSGI